MTRTELEHVIRAAAAVCGEKEVIVMGSQAILAEHPDCPGEFMVSNEADICPVHDEGLKDLITGSLGEGSRFERTFGYYADGIGRMTCTLPRGWEDRLVRIRNENTLGLTGWCLETHDVAIAKYVAGREKDRRYTRDLADYGLSREPTLLERLETTDVGEDPRRVIEGVIRAEHRTANRQRSVGGKLRRFAILHPRGAPGSVVDAAGNMELYWAEGTGEERKHSAGIVKTGREMAFALVHAGLGDRRDLPATETALEKERQERMALARQRARGGEI